MRIYFEGFMDVDITLEEHNKHLEDMNMSDFEFRQNMKKELSKYFSEAYVNEHEQLKVTSIRTNNK